MRLISLLAFIAVLVTAVAAWTNEDYEIFDLVSALETAEGKGTTFYSWLDVRPTASTSEIAKAYRRKSILLHPDKNPNVKGIHERFSRLGVIAAILRNDVARARYDFFYKNGVPKWRGTGYYYSRFRPGLGSVLVFLTILTSGLQYLIQRMNYRRDLERVEKVLRDARVAAWGPKLTPIEGRRKIKVPLGGPRRIDRDGNVIEGKYIDMVVDGQSVYILEPTGELQPLDSSAAVPPSLSRTWFIVLIVLLYKRLSGRRSDTDPFPETSIASDEEESSTSESAGSRDLPRRDDSEGPGRVAAVKAGGRRRKIARKR